MSFETEKEIQFDDLLFYLRQGAGLIEGFPKMAGRECVPPEVLRNAADEIEQLRNRLADALKEIDS